MPLAGWGLLLGVFGRHVARDLPVAVVDLDGSALSRRLVRAIDATPAARVVAGRGDATDAAGFLRRGEAYAVVVLPAGLERDVERGAAPRVQALTNGVWLLPATLVGRDVRAAVATVSAELEVRARVARGEPPTRATVAAEPVRAELRPLFNPALAYARFLFLALVPTLLHMSVLTLAVHALGSELRWGTAAAWLTAAGGRAWTAVLGKLLPYTLWFALLWIALVEAALGALDLAPAGSRALWWAAAILVVVAYQGLGALLVAATGNLRLATSVAGLLAGPAFAVVGVTFPRVAMPAAARAWAAALPLTHYLDVQAQQVTVGAPARASLAALGALLAMAVLLHVLALPRLARLARDPLAWGRT